MSVKLRDNQQVDLDFADDALVSIANNSIERKTGTCGLRSILEDILLDTIFDMKEVMIDKAVVEVCNELIRVYADKNAGDAA